MKLTIVYDNEATPPFKEDWELSCYIEKNETRLLFDTGANGDILLHNMGLLGINPGDIDAVVLSHEHKDHNGGLGSLLKIKPDITVYTPTFSKKQKEILADIMTTGVLEGNGVKEQALICFITENKVVVVTGCSHPGLEHILRIARGFGDVHALIGGFHGFNRFNVLKRIPRIVPCHCTKHIPEIKQRYPDAYEAGGVGKTVRIMEGYS